MAARILVPLALVACVGAVVAMVADTMSASEDPAPQRQRPAAARGNNDGDGGQSKKKPAEYVVESGDTLSGIAEKTGVPIERIMRKNPDLDPRVLNAGQVIKLR